MIAPYLAVTTDTAPGVAMPLAAATVGVAPEDDDDEDPPPHADSWNARTRAASAAMRKLMGSAPQQGLDGRHLRRTNNHAVNREQGDGASNSSPVRPQGPDTATDRGGPRRRRNGSPRPGLFDKSAKMGAMSARHHAIRVRGARQNNLKDLDLDLPAGELIRRCAQLSDVRLTITFPITVPANFSSDEIRTHLEAQGYARLHGQQVTASGQRIDVVQDRLKAQAADRQRLIESVEAAMHRGGGRVDVYAGDGGSADELWRFSSDLHCADCDIHYSDPT